MRGQASFEFLVIVIVVLFFILTVYVASFGKTHISFAMEKQIENICRNIANDINNVFYFGNGFRQNISLPKQISGTDYSITVYNKTLICAFDKQTDIWKFFVNEITNGTNYPPFTIPKREIRIENYRGIIVIT